MIAFRSGLSIFLSAVLFATASGQSKPTCPKTADECVDNAKFDKLSKGDPSFYCEEAAKLVAETQNLLRACKFPEQNTLLENKKADINAFCSEKDSEGNCPNVTDTFVAQTRCYDDYGGLDKIISDIVIAFEAGVSNFMEKCNPLYWGRYCQKTQTCQYNKNLDDYLIIQNKQIGFGLAICGSESLKSILQLLEQSEGCPVGNDMDAKILKNCDISCDAADAGDDKAYCELLEKQAACLQQETAGCSRAERKYVKPRLNSYAIANRYLGCNIKYNGITVKPSGRTFDYSALVNQCMFSKTVEPLKFWDLQPLYNFDTPYLADFCNSRDDQEKLIADCRNAFLAAATPQAKLLSRTEDDLNAVSIDIVPKIGTFSVDSHGMAYIYNSLPDVCPQNIQWSERICVPSSDRTVPPGEKSTRSAITPKPKSTPARGTRDPNSVDFPSTSGNNGNGDGGHLPRGPAQDKTINDGSSGSGRGTVVSAVLLITSALLSLIHI